MLNDMDQETQHLPQELYQQDPQPRKRKIRHPLLLGWAIWVVFSVSAIALSLPMVINSIKVSGVVPMVEQYLSHEGTATADSRTVEPVFVKVGLTDASRTFTPVPTVQKRTGAGIRHDSIEALLAGPSQNAISQGIITCIAPGTRLIGLTVSERVAFVDLGSEFTHSEDIISGSGMDAAVQQVKRTLLNLDGIDDVAILVEGQLTDY